MSETFKINDETPTHAVRLSEEECELLNRALLRHFESDRSDLMRRLMVKLTAATAELVRQREESVEFAKSLTTEEINTIKNLRNRNIRNGKI